MTHFLDLPIELLPLILSDVLKSDHLASTARVNKTWNVFATPRLYERVSIFSWHREAKTKVLMLFKTLACHPHLARHVRRLGAWLQHPFSISEVGELTANAKSVWKITEIRDFPKAILALPSTYQGEEGGTVLDLVRSGLENCVALDSCVWTRDGSLSSEILGALARSVSLRSLEFNGHSQGQYDPSLLGSFKALEKMVVIMPSTDVVRQIRGLVGGTGGERLRSLTIICKSSPVVNDEVLKAMAPSLTNLEQFYVTGCPKVTERGVSAIVSSTKAGLRALGLESVSQKFDMTAFAEHCTHTQALTSLRSITLAVSALTLLHVASDSPTSAGIWTQAVLQLLSLSSHLEKFHIYAAASNSSTSAVSSSLFSLLGMVYATLKEHDSGSGERTSGPSWTLARSLSTFWRELVRAHGATLKRFSVLRMPIGMESVKEVCRECPQLEELFLVTDARSLDGLPEALRLAPKLRTVHVNFPVRTSNVSPDELDSLSEDEGESDEDGEDGEGGSQDLHPVLSPSEALAIVRRCGPSLTQFGCNTKVWHVGWKITKSEGDELASEMVLLPYESPDIPEPFLVVRT